MEYYYIIAIVVLFVFAIIDLMVGVSNDATNFITSALGAKVAPRRVILLVASVGIICGTLTSTGMMEIARNGIFVPGKLTFEDVMIIFLSVLLTDVILLDFFNSLGLPTSTTVSLVFELIGATVVIGILKISQNSQLSLSNLGDYINSAKAFAIISGILISVVIAFVVGSIVQFFTRMLFTFQYKQTYKYFGGLFGGMAITAILYFIVIKGIKSASFVSPAFLDYINEHTWTILVATFFCCTFLFQTLILITKISIFKFIVLLGTFALALAFAGNDLVNFIGVSMAGLTSFQYFNDSGVAADALNMDILSGKVVVNPSFLIIAGGIMVLTLWISKKSRTVSQTEVGLSRQDEGVERFGSTLISRTIVRGAMRMNTSVNQKLPEIVRAFIRQRFRRPSKKENSGSSYDIIRASVNLTVASILIAMATSLKLPLSTTYVTFMVAMGTSLADRAWGRESAVYRITGVLTVISGWFLTAFIAFTIAAICCLILYYLKFIGLIILTVFALSLLLRFSLLHKKRTKAVNATVVVTKDIISESIEKVKDQLAVIIHIYNQTITGLTKEDRKMLREVTDEVDDLKEETKDMKKNLYYTLRKLEDESVENSHFYVQIIDYLREISHSLSFITHPSYEHIDNNHKGLNPLQSQELLHLSAETSKLFAMIQQLIEQHDYTNIVDIISQQHLVLALADDLRKNQVQRIKDGISKTRNSILYFALINESKNILLQTVNLTKALRDFHGITA